MDSLIPMINIDQLHQNRESKMKRKKEIYDEVLRRCHHRIKISAKNDSTCFCFYVIPNFIYGIPLYDNKVCILYLVNCLSYNGFDVKYTHPNLLYISWHNKKNPKHRAAIKPKLNNNNFKKINDYKPTGKFIYDQESVNLLNNKAFSLLEN
jgi:hypothetical protein